MEEPRAGGLAVTQNRTYESMQVNAITGPIYTVQVKHKLVYTCINLHGDRKRYWFTRQMY